MNDETMKEALEDMWQDTKGCRLKAGIFSLIIAVLIVTAFGSVFTAISAAIAIGGLYLISCAWQ